MYCCVDLTRFACSSHRTVPVRRSMRTCITRHGIAAAAPREACVCVCFLSFSSAPGRFLRFDLQERAQGCDVDLCFCIPDFGSLIRFFQGDVQYGTYGHRKRRESLAQVAPACVLDTGSMHRSSCIRHFQLLLTLAFAGLLSAYPWSFACSPCLHPQPSCLRLLEWFSRLRPLC